MSNTAYLCCSRSDELYPSSTDAEYDSKQQTIAIDVNAIPLMWLAAFREPDLVTQTINDDDGNAVTVTAPICDVERALSNLDAAGSSLNQAFPDQPNLDGYRRYLKQAIESCGFPWITMEISEIEYMIDPQEFQSSLRACLRGFDGIAIEAEPTKKPGFLAKLFGGSARPPRDWKSFLLEVTDLKPQHPFPKASMFEDDLDFSDHESWTHCRLLGDSLFRPVPWIPTKG